MAQAYKAMVGSISEGTLRTEDLLSSFAWELKHIAADIEHPGNKQTYLELVSEAEAIEDYDSDEASELVSVLIDALNECAPPYCYFGANEGDGASFGFWPSMESIEELPKVSDPSEVRKHIGEDCVFVNDHGNVTVYDSNGQPCLEIV